MTLLGGFFLVRVQTEYLSPTEYGELALALTIAALANQVISGGLASGLLRFYSVAREQNDLTNYAATVVIIHSCAAALIVAVGLLIAAVFVFWLDNSRLAYLVVAVTAFSTLAGMNSSLDSIQTAARQRMLVAMHMSSVAWLKIILLVLLFGFLGIGPVVAIWAYSLAVFAVMISQASFVFRSFEISREKLSVAKRNMWNKKVLSYALPFSTFGVFTWIQQSSPRWALGQYSSVSDVGLFAVVVQIGYAPVLALTGFATVLISPILFEMIGEEKQGERVENVKGFSNKLAFCGLIFTALIVVIAALFHDSIFHLLISEEYHVVSRYLPIVVAAGGVFAISQIYANRILAILMSKILVPATIASSLVGTAAAYIGVYYFSILGAVYAMLIFSTTYLAMLLLIIRNNEQISI